MMKQNENISMRWDDNMYFKIKEKGEYVSLFTQSGLKLSDTYSRIVTGERGPYVEFYDTQINLKNISIPREQLYRLSDLRVYYVEFRSNDLSNIKIYYQLKTVAYADYRLGMFYISPFDLYFEDKSPIVKSDNINEKSFDFFE